MDNWFVQGLVVVLAGTGLLVLGERQSQKEGRAKRTSTLPSTFEGPRQGRRVPSLAEWQRTRERGATWFRGGRLLIGLPSTEVRPGRDHQASSVGPTGSTPDGRRPELAEGEGVPQAADGNRAGNPRPGGGVTLQMLDC